VLGTDNLLKLLLNSQSIFVQSTLFVDEHNKNHKNVKMKIQKNENLLNPVAEIATGTMLNKVQLFDRNQAKVFENSSCVESISPVF